MLASKRKKVTVIALMLCAIGGVLEIEGLGVVGVEDYIEEFKKDKVKKEKLSTDIEMLKGTILTETEYERMLGME